MYPYPQAKRLFLSLKIYDSMRLKKCNEQTDNRQLITSSPMSQYDYQEIILRLEKKDLILRGGQPVDVRYKN